MKISMTLDLGKMTRLIDDKTRVFANTTYHKHMTPYIPRKDGYLFSDVTIEPDGIHFNMIYAAYQYVGISHSGNPLNYSKDKHPLAQSHWDEPTKLNHADTISKEVRDYIVERQNES